MLLQDYDDHFCKCRCKESGEREQCRLEIHGGARKFWDEENCRCLCQERQVFQPMILSLMLGDNL